MSDRNDYISVLKEILSKARLKAYSSVNTAIVEAHWMISKRITLEFQSDTNTEYYEQAFPSISEII